MASAFVSTLGEMPWRAVKMSLDIQKNLKQKNSFEFLFDS